MGKIKGLFLLLIAFGVCALMRPLICNLIYSGLIYDPVIMGLTAIFVGCAGYLFLEIHSDDYVYLLPIYPDLINPDELLKEIKEDE